MYIDIWLKSHTQALARKVLIKWLILSKWPLHPTQEKPVTSSLGGLADGLTLLQSFVVISYQLLWKKGVEFL